MTVFGTVQSAGSSIEWLRSIIGTDTSFTELDRLSGAVPPGSRGLFYLPYLQGERAPLWDADARGVFFGLTPSHGRPEIYRSVLEGIAFALRSILDVYAENGHPLPELRVLGGGANSELWRTILAGVFERRLLPVTGVSSATCLGAAMAAGVGVGIYPSIAEAGRRLTSLGDPTDADAGLAESYRPRMELFRTMYPSMKELFGKLSALGR